MEQRDLFAELQLTRRWRIRSEHVEPIRVEAPPEPPEDPLAERVAEDGAAPGEDALAPSAAGDAESPRPSSSRPGGWRNVLRRAVAPFVEPDEEDVDNAAPDAGESLAGAGGRAMDDAPRPKRFRLRRRPQGDGAEDAGPSSLGEGQPPSPGAHPPAPEGDAPGARRKGRGRWRLPGLGRLRPSPAARDGEQGEVPDAPRVMAERELVAFVGALPRSGTTTALAGWALARAEGGEEVIVIDAHAERPFLPVHLMGRVARQGWMDALHMSVARLMRYVVPVAGVERLRMMPLGWNPAVEAPVGHEVAGRLPDVVEAARRAGGTAIAVDLGAFRPLCNQQVDARLQWAAREAGIVAIVTPNDVLGIDAAARMVVAARAEGARKVVLLLVGGEAEVSTAHQVQRALAALEPPAVVDAVVPVPWEPAIQRALGREVTPLRIGALLPNKQRKGAA